jgi:NADPH:quinone reductase
MAAWCGPASNEAGKVRPIIHATFSLADVRQAHELMETSTHIGKIMLKVKGDG